MNKKLISDCFMERYNNAPLSRLFVVNVVFDIMIACAICIAILAIVGLKEYIDIVIQFYVVLNLLIAVRYKPFKVFKKDPISIADGIYEFLISTDCGEEYIVHIVNTLAEDLKKNGRTVDELYKEARRTIRSPKKCTKFYKRLSQICGKENLKILKAYVYNYSLEKVDSKDEEYASDIVYINCGKYVSGVTISLLFSLWFIKDLESTRDSIMQKIDDIELEIHSKKYAIFEGDNFSINEAVKIIEKQFPGVNPYQKVLSLIEERGKLVDKLGELTDEAKQINRRIDDL